LWYSEKGLQLQQAIHPNFAPAGTDRHLQQAQPLKEIKFIVKLREAPAGDSGQQGLRAERPRGAWASPDAAFDTSDGALAGKGPEKAGCIAL
jgi:hypothetical protein